MEYIFDIDKVNQHNNYQKIRIIISSYIERSLVELKQLPDTPKMSIFSLLFQPKKYREYLSIVDKRIMILKNIQNMLLLADDINSTTSWNQYNFHDYELNFYEKMDIKL
jgi:hypothetical protein